MGWSETVYLDYIELTFRASHQGQMISFSTTGNINLDPLAKRMLAMIPYYKVTIIPLVITQCFREGDLRIQIFCSSLSFSPLILAFITGPHLQQLLSACFIAIF